MEKRLINLVKEHEFLYNRKAIYYKDLARKDEKWVEIAAELNIEVKKAKQRWKSLRDRFAREFGKMKAAGAETQDVNWKYFDSLIFLKDCTEPRERNMAVKQEVKTELNPKNINELFSTFLSENEESGQGTSGNRSMVQENGNSFQKNLPVLFKIERTVDCTSSNDAVQQQQQHHAKFLATNSTGGTLPPVSTIGTCQDSDERSHQHHNAGFHKDNPILISFDNTAMTAAAKGDGLAKSAAAAVDANRYVQTAAITAIQHTTGPVQAHQIQNETFIRSFFNAMAIQVEQANINFHVWATIQQEVMEVVNRNILQSIHQATNRMNNSCIAQTQTANGIS